MEMFDNALGTFSNLEGVIESLYEKTQKFKAKYHS